MIGLDRPIDVVGDEKVELAVIIVIKPHRAGGKSRIGRRRFRGNVGKLAVAEIAEKMVGTDGGDVDIDVAIVIIVTDGAAQSRTFQLRGQPAASHR